MILAPTPRAIALAAETLRRGGLVGMPTETVYGLAADATSGIAVAGIFAAKGRPRFNPLITHLRDVDAARDLATWTEHADRLAHAFWPGPLTLVLGRAAACPVADLATAGLDSIALRVPAHPVARALLEEVALPLAAPSANPSGRVSPTTAAHVQEGLGHVVEVILDGGPCPVGVESTVLDLTGSQPALLRPGAVTRAEIEALTGPLAAPGEEIRSPGQLASHYAPGLPVRVDARERRPGEALLGFGEAADADLNLSPGGDPREAAANLFAMLRALDRPPFTAIAVSPVPTEGLGEAINDRLRRAASR